MKKILILFLIMVFCITSFAIIGDSKAIKRPILHDLTSPYIPPEAISISNICGKLEGEITQLKDLEDNAMNYHKRLTNYSDSSNCKKAWYYYEYTCRARRAAEYFSSRLDCTNTMPTHCDSGGIIDCQ